MKSLSGILGSLVLTILLVFCLLLIAQESFAVDTADGLPDDGRVEVVYPAQNLVPYKERRHWWAPVFAVNVDQVYPGQFRSSINDEIYEDLFGDSPVNIIQGQLGLKLNFALGAVAFNVMYGEGRVEDGRIGDDRSLDLYKKAASAQFIMDNLFAEPYVAPYIEGQVYSFDWEEASSFGEVESGTTDFGSALTVGVLLQLNWLDPDSALQARESSGLNNVFVDLFVSQYNTSSGELDPDFQTGTNYGGGLRFEF